MPEMNSDFVLSRIKDDVFRLSGPYPPFLSMMLVYDKSASDAKGISGGGYLERASIVSHACQRFDSVVVEHLSHETDIQKNICDIATHESSRLRQFLEGLWTNAANLEVNERRSSVPPSHSSLRKTGSRQMSSLRLSLPARILREDIGQAEAQHKEICESLQ